MKKMSIICLLMAMSFLAVGQVRYNSGGGSSKPKERGFDPQKLVIGGGLGLGIGRGVTSFNISPLVGYQVAPNLLAGVSLGYQYLRIKDDASFYNTTTNRYESYPSTFHLVSPGLWLRYNLFNSFFVHTQFEYHLGNIRWTGPAQFTGGSGKEKVKANYSIPTLLVGAGYRMPMGDRMAMYLGVYYDVLQNSTQGEAVASNGTRLNTSSPYWGGIRPVIGLGIGF